MRWTYGLRARFRLLFLRRDVQAVAWTRPRDYMSQDSL